MANEIVKYNNKLNEVAFKGFTDTELKLFFAICSGLRDKGTDAVVFTFDQLRNLTGEKQHYTKQGYKELITQMYGKLTRLSFQYDDGEDVFGEFNIFEGYQASTKTETITIAVTQKFQTLLNQLTSNFTKFELEQFVNLRGKYTKHLYRQLKQFRMTGYRIFDIDDFRMLMDVPEKMPMRDVTKRVVAPSVEKLRELDCFGDLRYEYTTRSRKVTKVSFFWTGESAARKTAEDKEISDIVANSPFTYKLNLFPEANAGNGDQEKSEQNTADEKVFDPKNLKPGQTVTEALHDFFEEARKNSIDLPAEGESAEEIRVLDPGDIKPGQTIADAVEELQQDMKTVQNEKTEDIMLGGLVFSRESAERMSDRTERVLRYTDVLNEFIAQSQEALNELQSDEEE